MTYQIYSDRFFVGLFLYNYVRIAYRLNKVNTDEEV